MTQYQKDIEFIEGLANIPKTTYLLGPKNKKIFITRLKKFLNLIGNPQKGLKVIHITGTSGKGSTVKILESLIADAGLKVGSFTSPFATTSIERISINNRLISPKELHNILEKYIKPALDKNTLNSLEPISYFETWLAIALLHFKKQKCNWVILEAGLGGNHDATNIIEDTKIAAITNVGLDHMHILGNTKEKIAKDKAGIIKKNSIFLTAERNPKILKIFKSVCRQKKAWYINKESLVKKYNANNYFSTSRQKDNLNLALNILNILKIKPKNTQKIIDNFKLICRQEIVQKNPMVILDGAHNKDKIYNAISFVQQQKYKKLHLVLGFAENKNHAKSLKKLLSISDSLYLTRFNLSSRKSASLSMMYKESKKIRPKMKISVFNDPKQALENALKSAKKNDLVLVTGSFFLAGELRKKWIPEEYIIKNLTLDRK